MGLRTVYASSLAGWWARIGRKMTKLCSVWNFLSLYVMRYKFLWTTEDTFPILSCFPLNLLSYKSPRSIPAMKAILGLCGRGVVRLAVPVQ